MSPPEQPPPSLIPATTWVLCTPAVQPLLSPSSLGHAGKWGPPPAHAGGGTGTDTWQKVGLGSAGEGTAVLLARLVAGEGGPRRHRTWQAFHQL